MHGLTAALDEARSLAALLAAAPTSARVALCPAATLIAQTAQALKGGNILVGGQDCRAEAAGAFTGDVSPEMLKDAGAALVILGHSERRAGHGETDADVAAKVVGALRAALEPIVCVGESLDERRAGRAIAVVQGQVRASLPADLADRAFAVAYEPVWAIGTGLVPSLDDIAAVHAAIRDDLIAAFGQIGAATPILYGGSVKPSNASDILAVANVDGALVGGASLNAADFFEIIRRV